MEEFKTLRPGLLVSLHTSLNGNISYRTQLIDDKMKDGTHVKRWKTTRVITDKAEYEEAIKVRGEIRYLITKVCAVSEHGLLCPTKDAAKLRKAKAEAREKAQAFNESARYTRIRVSVVTGRIEGDDAETVAAIAGEVRGLMEDMKQGLKSLDVKAIRDACNKAKGLDTMLSEEARGQMQTAIDAARKAARRMVKAGEKAANEVDRFTLSKIDQARTSFLDIEEEAIAMVEPEMDGRALDLEVN